MGFFCKLFRCDEPPQCPVLKCAEGTVNDPDDVETCVVDAFEQQKKVDEGLIKRVGQLSREYVETYDKDFGKRLSYEALERKDAVCSRLKPHECRLVPGCTQAPAFQAVAGMNVDGRGARCASAEYASFVEKANIVVPKPFESVNNHFVLEETEWRRRSVDARMPYKPEQAEAAVGHFQKFCSEFGAFPNVEGEVHPVCSIPECGRLPKIEPLCKDPNATKEQIETELLSFGVEKATKGRRSTMTQLT